MGRTLVILEVSTYAFYIKASFYFMLHFLSHLVLHCYPYPCSLRILICPLSIFICPSTYVESYIFIYKCMYPCLDFFRDHPHVSAEFRREASSRQVQPAQDAQHSHDEKRSLQCKKNTHQIPGQSLLSGGLCSLVSCTCWESSRYLRMQLG